MAGFGIRLVRSAGMEGYTGNSFEFPIDPANTNPIFTGDPVALSAAGYVEEASGGADNNDFSILGTFNGVRFVDAEGGYKFRQFWSGNAGASEVYATVSMPAHGLYHIKGAAGAGYTRANTVGKRFGVTYDTGRTAYGESGISMGSASAATGPLLVRGLADLPNNTWDSEEPIFEVAIVRPQGA